MSKSVKRNDYPPKPRQDRRKREAWPDPWIYCPDALERPKQRPAKDEK